MARTGQFSHTQSGGTDVFDMIAGAGIKWYGAGEIIAWNTAAALDYSAAFAVKGWMGSPSHKAIVMSKGYNYVGFGLAISDTGKRYWAGVYLKGPDRTGAWSRIVGTAKRNLNSTDVRVWVKWSGGDIRLQVLTSGFRYYQVQRSINGSAWSSYPGHDQDLHDQDLASQQHLRRPRPLARPRRQLGSLEDDHDQDLTIRFRSQHGPLRHDRARGSLLSGVAVTWTQPETGGGARGRNAVWRRLTLHTPEQEGERCLIFT